MQNSLYFQAEKKKTLKPKTHFLQDMFQSFLSSQMIKYFIDQIMKYYYFEEEEEESIEHNLIYQQTGKGIKTDLKEWNKSTNLYCLYTLTDYTFFIL